jgi:tetratricopeptide (TPR) repeat protein
VDESLYRLLKWTAITLASLWVGWGLYESFVLERNPGDLAYLEGDQFFEDGEYDRALKKYGETLAENSQHIPALRGRAQTLMMLQRFPEARNELDALIAVEPDFGGNYATRGRVHDLMGSYEKAIADYEHALKLDPELAEGPHWLTRFLRKQSEKPPTIDERAAYLKAELAKPESERLLRVPEIDEKQRSYKQ